MRHLLFTACDVGTANFLLPVFKKLTIPYALFAQGEAAVLFKAKGIGFTPVPPCYWSDLQHVGEEILKTGRFTHVIAGTSWGATVDKAITQAAKMHRIPSVAIVEHWNLYRERFSRIENGEVFDVCMYMPDRIWVNDTYAKKDAIEAGLPEDKLIEAGQPFLESQYNRLISKDDKPSNNHIVFISERIKDDFVEGSSIGKKYNEYIVLDLLIESMDFSKNKLLIKLHPQEESDKYNYLKGRGLDIEVIKDCDIADLIRRSYKITGMGSMLLLEAALVRSDVISILPDTSPEEFIGNKIGATLFAPTCSDIKKYLDISPSPIGKSSFGERFLGSVATLVKLIENMQ